MPQLDTSVQNLLGKELCSLFDSASCSASFVQYTNEVQDFRRYLTDYEDMYLFSSLALDQSITGEQWNSFSTTLTSTAWAAQVTQKIQGLNGFGKCVTVLEAALPQQSGHCWSFDQVFLLGRNLTSEEVEVPQEALDAYGHEYCSYRKIHKNSVCDPHEEQDGTMLAKHVSFASFNLKHCADKVAGDAECGWSFSYNANNGLCTCARPGFMCSGSHYSVNGNTYQFQSGNFAFLGYEEEEDEPTDPPTSTESPHLAEGMEFEGDESEMQQTLGRGSVANATSPATPNSGSQAEEEEEEEENEIKINRNS